jgi:pyruvate formate lyase activating enzyme
MLKEARYYEPLDELKVRCQLCPHSCILQPGKLGKCQVKRNVGGKLIAVNYGLISAMHLDPIEKKPLYHFHPGAKVLSIGSVGCNLKCNYCQNHEISQVSVDEYVGGHFYEPEKIVSLAMSHPENLGIAYTYNEPTVYYEFMLETASTCKEAGLKNVMISNGYINRAPLLELLPFMDAFNIDLKAFTERFYRYNTRSGLKPVLETLTEIKSAGKHLELTYLLIPGQNDDMDSFKEMLQWIGDHLGKSTVLHLSRYFPAYRSRIEKTPVNLLFRFCEMARKYLDYVYLGNLTGSEAQNTICINCGKIVISRYGYFVQKSGIDYKGNCIYCNNHIVII